MELDSLTASARLVVRSDRWRIDRPYFGISGFGMASEDSKCRVYGIGKGVDTFVIIYDHLYARDESNRPKRVIFCGCQNGKWRAREAVLRFNTAPVSPLNKQ